MSRGPRCPICGLLTPTPRHVYCAQHSAERAAARLKKRDRTRTTRASAKERGYGSDHVRLRRQWAARIRAGELVSCARCATQILPDQAWDLDHRDDRTGYLGPSHARCNRATAAHPHAKRRSSRDSRQGAGAPSKAQKSPSRDW